MIQFASLLNNKDTMLRKIYIKFFKSIRLRYISHKVFLSQLNKYKKGMSLSCDLHNSHKEIYIFPYSSLGDIYILSIFLQNNFFNKEDYILCVPNEKCKYIALDNNIKNVIVLDINDIECLIKYASVNVEKDNIKILHFHYSHTSLLPDIVNHKKINFIQCYEQFVFHRKINTIQFLKKDNNISYTTYRFVEENNSAIIAPYAKSIKAVNPEFWNELVLMLTELGIKNLYTNCVKNEIPLQGTKKLSVTLNEIKNILNGNVLFFGLRSGLCDFISATTCQKYIFYPKTENYFSSLDFYSLKQIPFAKNFREYTIDNNLKEFSSIIQSIKQDISK